MLQQLIPGVYRAVSDTERDAAAWEWFALAAALDLDSNATALGVVTEIGRLRSDAERLALLVRLVEPRTIASCPANWRSACPQPTRRERS